MKKLCPIMFLVAIFVATTCFAQNEHPIDKTLKDEIAKDWTTTGMNSATLRAMAS